MAGTFNVGSVVYEVDMDTSRLLAARREVDAALNGLNGSMGRLEASVNRTERSIGSMERTMSSLSGVAKGLLAALSVQQVASYADAWTELNNKVANSVRTGETQAEVMQRIFDVSQATQSSLNGTATLYARLERGTRTYNTSAEDLVRLTTIINQGFAVSGATAQEAENAIIQLSQGIASGVLRGEEFNSVSEQGSRLMVALADSMGVSIGQLRAMAAQGKLTTDVVVKGLLSQGDVIGKEFANTTVSIAKGLQVAGNNVTKFFGENSTVKSFAAGFRDSVITISENLETLSSVLLVVAGIMGSRYAGALAMATSAKISDIAASRQQLLAEKQQSQAALIAANSVQRKALADKEAALSSLALAQAEYNVAKGSAAEMLALDALVAAKSRASAASLSLAQAETAQAAASARAAAAASAASVGIGLARGALSLIGGPGGAAVLAASAIFYFWQKAQQAREEALRFADSLDKVNASMKAMNNTQLRGTIADANESIRAQKDEISDLQAEVDSLSSRYRNFTPEAQAVAESLGQGADFARQQAEVSDQLAKKSRDLANAQDKLAQTQETAAEANRTLTNNMLTSMGVHDGLIQKGWSLEQVQSAVAKAFGNTADEINRANQAGQNFNPKALQVSPPTADGDKVILNLEEQNELLKIQDERQRAVTKARMQVAKVTDNPNQISKAGDLAGENYDLQKAEEARHEAQRKGEQQDKRSASAAESVAQKLDKLRAAQNLSTESVEKRRIQEAGLRAEQSLGSGATQKQLEEARALGEANERAAISIQKRKEAEQGQKYAKQEIASAKTTVDPSTGQAVDPLAQINLQEQQKLDALAKYQEIDKQNTKLYEDAKTAIMQQASYQRQAILLQEQQTYQQNVSSLLGESSNFAGSLADAIGQAAGKSSAAYQALFAISKGFAIAQASLNLQTAISNAMAIPWPYNIPAIAQALSAGTQIVSAISGINYSGGRKNGGSVSPGNVYPVGEGNLPELMQTSKGLFMIPGDGGKVFSNKDVTSGSPRIKKASTGSEYQSQSNGDSGSAGSQSTRPIEVNIQFYDQTSGGQHSFQAQAMQEGNVVTVDAFLNDLDRGGPMTSGIKDRFGLSIKANGAY
ncbi:tail length tape measure protein [Klebsiella pneumoniae]|uniref:Tail length tape measure protein n=1 Tax=Klebsiella pneumoniae TaxID=573 RepID=A0A378C6R3_KLEPN|nr:tail length tape measure protein [Klebsiella pneumoniae]STU51986.1 tail length tape measure protein [Klebsiella pneumoniae]STV63383.1 tail length tape measure protein [Klebsiella pneumoniae]